MANLERSRQRGGLVAIDAAMTLIIFLLVVQIWSERHLGNLPCRPRRRSSPGRNFLRTPLLGMPGSGPLCDASRPRVAQTLTN